jgi:hypothetical protein
MERKIAEFEIKDILPIGLTLVVTGIGIAYGMSVMGDMSDDFCDGTYYGGQCWVYANHTELEYDAGADFNASKDAIEGVAKLPQKLPLIVNVIVAAIIIGILIRYLMVRFN